MSADRGPAAAAVAAPPGDGGAGPQLEQMRSRVARLLEMPAADVADDDDLLHLGMSSIQVMRLAGEWRKEGADITYAQLIERRTLREWAQLWAEKEAEKERAAAGKTEPPAAAEVDDAAPFELATMQLAYWVGRDDRQPLGNVGAQFYCEFDGEGVRPARLERAVRALFARHPMLRARFLDDGRQQILARREWTGITVHDLRALGDAGSRRRAGEIRHRLCQRRMDAERGETFDVQLSLLPGGRTRVHVMVEMLVCDGESFRILLADLAALYAAHDVPLPALGYSFPRYLAHKARQQALSRERDRAWWQARLPDLPGPPQLPLTGPPGQVAARTHVRRCHTITGPDWQRLAKRSRAHSVLLSMVLATAFAEVVGAWSSSPSFLLNMPFYDRDDVHPDVRRIVGDFTNLVLVGADVSEDLPFAERVRRFQRAFHENLAHASYTGVEVMRDLARASPVGGLHAPVVFTSAVNLGELFGEELRHWLGAPGYTASTTPQVWLDCQVTERGGELFVNWDAVEELFPAGVLDAMFGAFAGLVGRLVEGDWGEPVGGLVPAGQVAVRAGVNATCGPVAGEVLHEGFFRWAGREPGRAALWWGESGRWSFGELADRALRVAALLGSRGVVAGDLVGVTVGRGPQQVAAVLGVLAAGGVYVPVGVDQPVARRERIYRGAGVRCVVTGAAERAGLEWPAGVPVVSVEEAWGVAPLRPVVAVRPGDLAYVIYTSGSTGGAEGRGDHA